MAHIHLTLYIAFVFLVCIHSNIYTKLIYMVGINYTFSFKFNRENRDYRFTNQNKNL